MVNDQNKNQKSYYALSIPVLKKMGNPLLFNIFIKRSDSAYTRIFKKGDSLDAFRIEFYCQEKGVDYFYVEEDEYDQYLVVMERVFYDLSREAKEKDKMKILETLKDMLNVSISEIVLNARLDNNSVGYAKKSIKAAIDYLGTDFKSLARMMGIFSHYPYQLKHGMSTCLFSLLLAKACNITSDKTLEAIGLGAIIHDIGMERLSFDEEKVEDLSPVQWAELKTHPELGKRIVDGVELIPQEAKMIILQHHEQPNGRGYPNGLYGNEIYLPAKIVSVCDVFTSLICRRSFREAFTPEQAIDIMQEDQGHFDDQILAKFVAMLNLKSEAA